MQQQSLRRFFMCTYISLLAVLTSLLIGQGLFLRIVYAHDASPNNYSCGNPYGVDHCYAFYDWHGGMNGAETHISIPFLGGRPGSDGFMDWEMWVAQDNNSGCSGEHNVCWVEAGLADDCCTFRNLFLG